MAILMSNLTLVVDANSLRISMPDCKARHGTADHVFVNLPNRVRDILLSNTTISPSVPIKTLDFDTETVKSRRRRPNSKPNAFGFDASNGLGDDNGDEDDGSSGNDRESEIRRRVKEIEEMRELEKKAEELQSRAEGGGGGGDGEEETEEEKKQRVRRELEKVAKEQAERRETAKLMFELGQKAYGRGMYGRAIEFMEGALTIIPRPTLFGGEIQIWLAMAYEANNRHSDCIALYQQLEKKHPSISIRRQAAELRYILQAPKLKISQDEMVTIPLIGSSYDSYAGSWSDKYKDRGQNQSGLVTTNQLPSSRDYLADFLVWSPPKGWEKSSVFWIVLTLWVGLVGAALFLQ
ncbi:Tetratricopeptide repeat-like superfamily protein [Cinnamomum micranthum f. kanehirae]|uniref:Tetratricopeptide repeat-like superfamily protein n=1 Tax=Cinnamomum micranthum f. kanehirae TaxID=337451 RepID=A0A443N749_9MAGN|nr:Tetratricopeptide repeat-like superfamily protein [Cinnamomum micranthum f. kanehirae]